MRILLAEDDDLLRKSLFEFLSNDLGYEVTESADGLEALDKFRETVFPMVLSDVKMPGLNGIDLLREIKKMPGGAGSDVVMMTAYMEVETAVSALRSGAYDYLLKPINLVDLKALVARIAEHQHLKAENFELKHRFNEKLDEATRDTASKLLRLRKAYSEVVGIGTTGFFSSSMQEILKAAQRLHADRAVPVTIEGETGTGKEILARLIHHGQDPVTEPFIPINCSAIAPSLFESELFGYEGGAFSGSRNTGQIGKLELAQGGTLFLDELGEMPLEMQPKLLRVLDGHGIYRVGGVKKIDLDIRIICATNRELEALIREGSFRKDLYYRLNVGRIVIPPLRQRPDDIIGLAELFLQECNKKRKRNFLGLSEEAKKILLQYDWPGNVRELQNAIERIVLMIDDSVVRPEHLGFLSSDRIDNVKPKTESVCFDPENIVLPPDRLDLQGVEDSIVRKAVDLFDGNKTQAAIYLGISRSSLIRRLQNIE